MNIDKLKELDDTFTNNYIEIMKSARTLCKSYTNDNVADTVHNAYLKLRTKINKDGFNGTNYMGYIWITVKNEYGMEMRKKTRSKTVYIYDKHYNSNTSIIDYTQIVETILIEQEEIVKSSQQYDNDLMDITKELFEYIELIFDDKQVYLFKNYYLTPKSTYKKLAKRTGYSIMDCSNIMKEMKKSIRLNFIDWYKQKYND